MAWVVDTCLLIDVLEDDPEFGRSSARLLDRSRADGLVLCPVSYAELAPAFEGNVTLQDEFLTGIGVDFRTDWTFADALAAHRPWHEHVRRLRAATEAKRPVADVMIGAFATRHGGLLTRNVGHFRGFFPRLRIRSG